MSDFNGFPGATLAFLSGIGANNEKAWFEAHRDLYTEGYVEPARAFVERMGPQLRALSPDVQFEAKINGSIGRVNRDTRFSRDKQPYKDHLDIFFWHGERKGWNQPGFFLRVMPEAVWMGSGMHHFDSEGLTRYRDAVVDERSGRALEDAVNTVKAAGDYAVGGMPRKTVPRGYDKAHPRAAYLLWEGLPAMARMSTDEAMRTDFADHALAHFRATWPVGRWLREHVTG